MRSRQVVVVLALAISGRALVVAQSPATQPAKVAPALERVLAYVPDETHLAVVVPNLESLVTGVAAFGRAIGVDAAADLTVPKLLDEPLGESAKAVDKSGALVVALSAQGGEPVLIASVGDVREWAATTKPTELAGGARLFELDERYIAVTKDNVGVFGREKDHLQAALKATGRFARRWTEQAGPVPANRQVLLWIDVPAWRDIINQQMTVITQVMPMGVAGAGPEAETAVALSRTMLDEVRSLLSQTETFVATARLDGTGAFLEGRAAFEADSAVAAYLKQVRPATRDLFRGLPAGPFAMAFAGEFETPPGTESLNEKLVKAMLKTEALKEKVGAEKFEAALRTSLELYRKLTGQSGVLAVAPQGAGCVAGGLYLTADGAAAQRDLRAVCEACPDLMNIWGTFPSTTLQHDTEPIAGATADVYRFRFGDDDKGTQMPNVIQMVYGKDATMYVAPHPDGVAYTVGPRDAARDLLSRLLSSKGPGLGPDRRVTALLTSFSPKPQGCFLMDVAEMVGFVQRMTEAVGVPFPPLQLKTVDAPLAGCAFYLQPRAVRGELFVPTAPIKAIVDAAESIEGGGTEPR